MKELMRVLTEIKILMAMNAIPPDLLSGLVME
jgi:hypothetical protein